VVVLTTAQILILELSSSNGLTMVLSSNFVGVQPMAAVERWSPQEKKRVHIPCPQVVKLYNGGMGGR
jgi:hypothetical protein